MEERTWFRTVITMPPFCLQATMNAENISPSRIRDTEAVDTLAGLGFVRDPTGTQPVTVGRHRQKFSVEDLRHDTSDCAAVLHSGYIDFGCINRYDLPAPPRKALSQPQAPPVSMGQRGELRLWDHSSVHRFARAVVAGASIAGIRRLS